MQEKESQVNNVSHDDEISLKELILKLKEWWHYLLSKWKIIIVAGLLGAVLGLTYALLKKPVYTAETTFVLEEGSSGSNLGQYAGLASMVGIDLGGGGGGIFEGDNIIELYKSRRMITQTLLSRGTFNGKNELLVDRYIRFNNLREGWAKQEHLKGLSFNANPDQFTITQDSILGIIVKDINTNYLQVDKPDKKLSIISVKVKSKDQLFAKAFADRIVENVNDFYVLTKTKKSAENLAILQHQADSVKQALNSNLGSVAAAMDANPNSNPAFQSLRVPSQRRQIDAQANAAIYQEVVKNLEIAKISLRKEAPLIQVIDKPVLPLEKDRLGKAKGIVLGGLIAGILAIICLLFSKLIEQI